MTWWDSLTGVQEEKKDRAVKKIGDEIFLKGDKEGDDPPFKRVRPAR